MYVYFIKGHRECPLIKIGSSKDPEKRLARLQTGCPFKLHMIGKIKCKSDFHARQMEKYAHNIFYKQRRHGEWFKLSEKHKAQLYSLIERAGDREPSRGEQEEIDRKLDAQIPWDRFECF